MTVLDLDNCIPDELAETENATVQQLLETQMSITQWSERQADVLDFIYRARTYRFLRERQPSD